MPKVSVIIPIYGVEQFIERCARSLFEQTIDDIEYIFVNDCTIDKSIEVLNRVIEDYPNRQDQIKIVNHSVNKGLPAARQTGISMATGDYIIHCDSDDWVTTDAYEKMYNKALQDNADIVICDFFISDGTTHKPYYGTMSNEIHHIIFNYINIWTHLVRRELYSNQISYPSGNMFEDKVVTIQLAFYANKISLLNEPHYYYFNNTSSICRVFTEEKCLNRFKQAVANVNIIESFLINNGVSEKYYTEILRLKYEARHQIAPITNNKMYYKEWKNCYKEIDKPIIFTNRLSIYERIRFILTYLKLFPLFKGVE